MGYKGRKIHEKVLLTSLEFLGKEIDPTFRKA